MKKLFMVLCLSLIGCETSEELTKRRESFLNRELRCHWHVKYQACFCSFHSQEYSPTWVPDKVCGK